MAVNLSKQYYGNRCAELIQCVRLYRSRRAPSRAFSCLFAFLLPFLASCLGPANTPPTELEATDTANTPATPPIDALLVRIEQVLQDNLANRQLSTDTHHAWQIMHGVLAYGDKFVVQTPEGSVNAIEYVLRGGSVKGFELRSGNRFATASKNDGEIKEKADNQAEYGVRAELDPGAKRGQGHRDQWLAYLASHRLPLTQVVQTMDGPRRLELWLRQVEWDVPLNFEREYSWTLMALVPYRSTAHRWEARDGQNYSIESLLRSEIDRLSPESACGGSHRLVAIAKVVNKRMDEGLPMTGTWADAANLVEQAIVQTLEFQNADGTLSSNYFERQGWSLDVAIAIGTTGHILEFLAVAAPAEWLTEKPMTDAVASLCRLLEQTRDVELECGALYHALSGLQIYQSRLRQTVQATGKPSTT